MSCGTSVVEGMKCLMSSMLLKVCKASTDASQTRALLQLNTDSMLIEALSGADMYNE